MTWQIYIQKSGPVLSMIKLLLNTMIMLNTMIKLLLRIKLQFK